MILHRPRRSYRVQGPTPPKSVRGLSLDPSNPRPCSASPAAPPQSSHPIHDSLAPSSQPKAPPRCFEAHLRCHLLQEAFPDPLSWSRPQSFERFISPFPLTLACSSFYDGLGPVCPLLCEPHESRNLAAFSMAESPVAGAVLSNTCLLNKQQSKRSFLECQQACRGDKD